MSQPTDVERPIDYLPRTRELYAAQESYRWVHNDTPPPFAPVTRDLGDCTVMLVSSSGMFIGGQQEPFGLADDATIREVPADVDPRYLWPAHFGCRTARTEGDPDTVFPLQRLHELADAGTIGAVADHAVTFIGGIYSHSHRRGREQLTPAVIESARRTDVDLALLVPV